jgi:hypothetical protein
MAQVTDKDRERARAVIGAYCRKQCGRLGESCQATKTQIVMCRDGMVSVAITDERERCLEEAAKKIRAECTKCDGDGRGEPSDEDADGNVHLLECEYCGRPMKVVRSLKTPPSGKATIDQLKKRLEGPEPIGEQPTAWCRWKRGDCEHGVGKCSDSCRYLTGSSTEGATPTGEGKS